MATRRRRTSRRRRSRRSMRRGFISRRFRVPRMWNSGMNFKQLSFRKAPTSGIFSTAQKVRLKYCSFFNGVNTSGVPQIFRGNSLNDPDFSGVGHQPMGYDQLASVFNRYMVHSCSIRVTLQAASAGGAGNVYLIVYPTKTSAAISATSLNNLLENPTSRWKLCNSTSGGSPETVRHFTSTSSIMGFPSWSTLNQALVGTDPINQYFWNVYAYNIAGDPLVTQSVQYVVELTYFCTFFEPIELLGS